MLYKYYTADLMVLPPYHLESPSIVIKTWRWRNPLQVNIMMKNQLESWGFEGHKLYNMRRIK